MDSIDHPPRLRFNRPAAVLGCILAVSLGLAFAPGLVTQRLRGLWREAIAPSLTLLETGESWLASRWRQWRHGGEARLLEAQQQAEQLAAALSRVSLQVQLERAKAADTSAGEPVPPLLLPHVVPARVLGRSAKAFLRSHELLDVGASQAAAPGALVLEDLTESAVVDQGTGSAVQSGQLVLAGSRVWGKVTDVAQHTSTICRVGDAGYRDLVQLAATVGGKLRFTTRGVLVGYGQGVCKIELVEATQPVNVGDLVLTADDGVLDAPLLYGRVAKLQRTPGSAHWEIWMQSAIDAAQPPARVAVLRLELNPARVAAAGEL